MPDYRPVQIAVVPMRRPLLGIVLCYLAGTCAGVWIACFHFFFGLALAGFVLIIAFGLRWADRLLPGKTAGSPKHPGAIFVSRFFPVLASGLVYIAVFLAGWLAINLRINSPSPRDLSSLMDRPREGVEIVGLVADDPALRKGWRDDSFFCSFKMRVEALSRVGFFQKARGEISVTMPQNENEARPFCGERWRLTGVLIDNLRLAGAPCQNSIQNRLPTRFSFQVDQLSGEQMRLAKASSWNILRWCFSLRQKCADILARGIAHRPDVVGILQAFVLGRQYELPADLREAFVATGTYHIFAISGQHVAIIAIFVVAVLQVYRVCRLDWFYYLAPVLIVFTVMTGMSASAVRGCLMALMCFLGPLLMRRTDISSAMAFAALLIVGADPLQLFQAGFILSFGCVAGLIILCPPLIAMVENLLTKDPYRLEAEDWPARTARSAMRWVLFMMAASLAAWLVSTPLIARWFNLVSPVALPANLFVIPMATLVLLAGCLSIVFGWFCPIAAEAFNFANVFLVSLMTGVTQALAQIPFGHIFVRSPPLWFVGLWFGVLVVWRIYYQKIKFWLTAVLVLFIAGLLAWLAQRKEWEVHVFNVEQCAVCFVDSAPGGHLLLNSGPRYQARNLLRYMRKMGVNRIQALACPFPDAKHIGGAKEIMSALPVSRIWCGAKRPRTGFMKELCLEAEKKRIGVGELTNGIWRIQSGKNGWTVDVFDGGNFWHQIQDENPMARCSPGQLTIFVNAGMQTQAMTGILIYDHQSLPLVDLEEAPVSGSLSNAAASARARCRILFAPTTEEREQNFCTPSSVLQPSAPIVLGPGQGVLLLPDKGRVKIKALSLNP